MFIVIICERVCENPAQVDLHNVKNILWKYILDIVNITRLKL